MWQDTTTTRQHSACALWLWRCLCFFFLALFACPACVQTSLLAYAEPSPRGPEPGTGARWDGPGGPYQQSWAVVIGIDTYKDAKQYPALGYAVNDARSVAAALPGFGFPPKNIFVLENQAATKAAIEKRLDEQLQSGDHDRLLVFFAGHGAVQPLSDGGSEGFLIPYDTDPVSLARTAIAMEDIPRMGRRIKAKHILFVIDACYSGFSTTRVSAPVGVTSVWLPRVMQERVVQVLTAGRTGERVWENKGHGLFTAQFLRGLERLAAAPENTFITALELAAFVQAQVRSETKGAQNPQYGQLAGEGHFIFPLSDGQRSAHSPPPPTGRLTEGTPRGSVAPSVPGSLRLQQQAGQVTMHTEVVTPEGYELLGHEIEVRMHEWLTTMTAHAQSSQAPAPGAAAHLRLTVRDSPTSCARSTPTAVGVTALLAYQISEDSWTLVAEGASCARDRSTAVREIFCQLRPPGVQFPQCSANVPTPKAWDALLTRLERTPR